MTSMKIIIADRDQLCFYTLPEQAEDVFSFSYQPNGMSQSILLVFNEEAGQWYLQGNGTIEIYYHDQNVSRAPISSYQVYVLDIQGREDHIMLYTAPHHEMMSSYILENTPLVIGNEEKVNILNPNFDFHGIACILQFQQQQWLLHVSDQTEVFINAQRVIEDQPLYLGDVIYIESLKIIFMGSFLQINQPNIIQVNGLQPYSFNQNEVNTNYTAISEEERNVNLYQENDYFYHIPRLREVVEPVQITIDAPPGMEKHDELPFVLTIGSTITMGASSLMMGWNVVYSLSSGTRSVMAVVPQIVMCVAMIIGSLIIPKIASRYQKKKQKEREQERQEKYQEYLQERDKYLNQIQNKQSQILHENATSIKDCLASVESKDRNFWSRNIRDDDFLQLRLGIGNCKSEIEVNAPEEHFSLEEDNLLKLVYQVVQNHKELRDVPITFSLLEHPLSAFILNTDRKWQYLDEIILQIVALHSPMDLKIVVFTNSENEKHWEYFRFLPHCWSDDKEQRFFATTLEEAKDVSNYISEQLKKRTDKSQNAQKELQEGDTVDKIPYKNYSPYYLIINDDYQIGKNVPVIQELMKYENNYGFSLLIVEDSLKMLPPKCQSFVQIDQKNGAIMDQEITSESQTKFLLEVNPRVSMRSIAMKLANIPFSSKEGTTTLPASLPFLDMFGVSRIEQLNVLNRWKVNNPVTSLATVIGVHPDGSPFLLDLHEKFHGPHGLIAGSTGSGKSEFIITYILSLALNYDPREVQFVLIDYKGGGLAGAFENKETGVRIPHLIGTITNLDTNEMNRTLVSIESEMKRRQRVFNEVKDALGEGTIDIYKYQKLYRSGQVKEPMAHLFIISDEFAELKSQQPEFMSQLISTARIGRSLGIHLILATQKPSGIVNDQIWSNSKFKICLKVQDRSDSMEVLKRPDAATIRETGRFYLQVGYNDLFEIGQSGWSGAKYIPSDRIIKKIDDSISFVNHVGYVEKSMKDEIKVVKQSENLGDQLINLVKYLYDLGKKEHLVTKPLWLEKIPPVIYLSNLKQKYSHQVNQNVIAPIIGEYDNPMEQSQGLVILDLTNQGNTLIYGASGSGKENLLTTMLFSIVTEHTPEEVNIYILDFGSGFLQTFHKISHVGEVVTIDDAEKLVDTFKMLDKELESRKTLFADYGGSYVDYCSNSGNKLPLIVTVINNYDIFVENYANISEQVQTLYRDGSKYGIVFVITVISTSAVRARMMQNFTHLLCLQIPNEMEYRNILKAPRGLFPLRYFGRGLVAMNDTAYEFQTALIYYKNQIAQVIRDLASQMQDHYSITAKKIPSVPKIVDFKTLLDSMESIARLPIGYDIVSKKVYTYNFDKNPFTLILTSYMDQHKIAFLYALIKMMKTLDHTEVRVIDFVKAYEYEIDGITCYQDDFNQAIIAMNNEVIQNRDNGTNYIYFILGIGELKNKVSPQGREVLTRLYNSISSLNNSKFILVDIYASFKNIQIEPWYQSTIDNSCGIWLGPEVGSQVAINITNLTMDDRKLNFEDMAFAVDSGKHVTIKHIVDMEVIHEE